MEKINFELNQFENFCKFPSKNLGGGEQKRAYHFIPLPRTRIVFVHMSKKIWLVFASHYSVGNMRLSTMEM